MSHKGVIMSFNLLKSRHIIFSCAIGGVLPFHVTLLAQDSPGNAAAVELKATESAEEIKAKAAKKNEEKSSERMKVTGSRLKKIDMEGSVPIKIITAEEIEKAGITTLSDVFRNQTENTFGSFNGGSDYISEGQATVNLRGLGADRTLVLVNGRRLPAEASLGGVNINNIPVSMIERVEQVKMSASAIYGADAVSGVINVILKKDYTGLSTSLTSTTTEQGGGENQSFSAVGGVNVGNTNITVAAGASQTQPLFSRNRDELWKYKGNYAYSAFANPPGTYSWALVDPNNVNNTKGDYVFRPSANCPEGNQIAFPNAPQTVMFRGLRRDASTGQYTSEKENWYGTINTNTALANNINLNATIMFADAETRGALVDRIGTTDPLSGADYQMRLRDAPAEIQAQVNQLGLVANDETMIKVLSRSLPYVKGNSSTRDTATGVMVGLGGPMASNWDWQLDLSSFSTLRQRFYNNVDDKQTFTEDMFPNNGDTPKLNLFNPDQAVLDEFFVNLYGKERNGISSATTYMSGPLGKLPNGEVSIAFGLNYQQETYELIADQKDKLFFNEGPRYWGSVNSDGTGERDVNSVFAELSVPLLPKTELGIAGRLDNYSDFGSTFNYAGTLGYAPFSFLKLRSNYGTSFKAPALALLYNKSDGGYLSVTDKKYCDLSKGEDNPCGQDGEGYSVYVNNPGNVELKEETAVAWNFGFVLQPVEFFDLTMDYWAARIDGMHSQESLDKIIEREILGQSIGSSSVTRVNDASRADNGKISLIENSYANLGTTTTSGFDIETNLRWNLASNRVGLRTQYSNVITRKEKESSETPAEEYVGAYGVPRYRTSNELSYRRDKHRVSLDALTIGRMESSQFDSDPSYGYVKAFTRYDTTYSWDHPWNGTLSLGVFNLENKIGGLHETDRVRGTVAFSGNNYDALGRRYYVAIKQSM